MKKHLMIALCLGTLSTSMFGMQRTLFLLKKNLTPEAKKLFTQIFHTRKLLEEWLTTHDGKRFGLTLKEPWYHVSTNYGLTEKGLLLGCRDNVPFRLETPWGGMILTNTYDFNTLDLEGESPLLKVMLIWAEEEAKKAHRKIGRVCLKKFTLKKHNHLGDEKKYKIIAINNSPVEKYVPAPKPLCYHPKRGPRVELGHDDFNKVMSLENEWEELVTWHNNQQSSNPTSSDN